VEPPVAAREAAYPEPTVAGGKVEVVTLSGAATLRVKERLVVLPVVSATWKESVVEPAMAGVPEMVPAAFRESPAGNWPAARDQV
jgi:hypothetical protein